MPEMAIQAEGLRRDYDSLRAVDGISCSVQPGEIFDFLGPSGAGKTTTVRMLAGLLRPTAGKAQVAGHDIVQDRLRLKAAVGLVPERSNLYDELSGLDNLIFMAQLYGLPRKQWRPRAEALLAEFGLEQAADRRFGAYSRGMRRRLTIAAALVHHPQVLFLDEPTTGLDVMSARSLRQTIRRLNREGVTIFLTTHLIGEAEMLCQQVAILVEGKIRAIDTPARLREVVRTDRTVRVFFAGSAIGILEKLRGHPDLTASADGEQGVRILAENPTRAVVALGQVLAQDNLSLRDIRLDTPSLEDAFVHITGLDPDVLQREKGERRKAQG